MKKCVALVLSLICVLGLVGCNKKSMNYIISNEPSISGIVEEVNENSILIYIQNEHGENRHGGLRWMVLKTVCSTT